MALSAPARAQPAALLDGTPVSHGLGPTYGEEWCAPVGSENVPQTALLALIPYGAIACTLDQFEAEAAAAGLPDRLDANPRQHVGSGRVGYLVVDAGPRTRSPAATRSASGR